MEHTLHERTASIAQLVVQGMGVLEISNAQQFNSVEVFFTAGNQVQNTLCHIPQNYTPRLKVSGKEKKNKKLLAQLNLFTLEKQFCRLQN